MSGGNTVWLTASLAAAAAFASAACRTPRPTQPTREPVAPNEPMARQHVADVPPDAPPDALGPEVAARPAAGSNAAAVVHEVGR